jgi:hypothetical protein
MGTPAVNFETDTPGVMSENHHGQEGEVADKDEQVELASKMGKDGEQILSDIRSGVEGSNGYNWKADDQLDAQYLNTALKLENLPTSSFENGEEAGKVYGEAKKLAMEGQGDELKALIEKNGGNQQGLSSDELVKLWGADEHAGLHSAGNRHAGGFGADMFAANHMTMLSDDGSTGGYNNTGDYPEWGWFEAAQKVEQQLGLGKASGDM